MDEVIWIIDTSSIVQVRRAVENTRKPYVFQSMTALVQVGRLCFPKQVVDELKRFADPSAPDDQFKWANENQSKAADYVPTLEQVQQILSMVPNVLDPDKDYGVDEADPYVLALAAHFRGKEKDARIVTEETKDTPKKMSLRTAGGLLGIASIPLIAFLQFEHIE
jgi:hypothetical protein